MAVAAVIRIFVARNASNLQTSCHQYEYEYEYEPVYWYIKNRCTVHKVLVHALHIRNAWMSESISYENVEELCEMLAVVRTREVWMYCKDKMPAGVNFLLPIVKSATTQYEYE